MLPNYTVAPLSNHEQGRVSQVTEMTSSSVFCVSYTLLMKEWGERDDAPHWVIRIGISMPCFLVTVYLFDLCRMQNVVNSNVGVEVHEGTGE